MTGRRSDSDESAGRSGDEPAGRSATIRTELDDAAGLAASVRPDNTPEIDTRVDESEIVTTVSRETTGGLQSTLDDYVVNLAVAQEVVQAAKRFEADQTDNTQS